jgi:hypothetical protein
MPFSYFSRLPPRLQKIYLQSDRITEIKLEHPELLLPLVEGLRQALLQESRGAVELAAHNLARGMTGMLEVPPLVLQVLAVRPRSDWGELHGLYTQAERGPAQIKLWMRTAAHKRPGGVQDVPAHADPRAGPPPRLLLLEARRLAAHRGLLPARVQHRAPAAAGERYGQRPEDGPSTTTRSDR